MPDELATVAHGLHRPATTAVGVINTPAKRSSGVSFAVRAVRRITGVVANTKQSTATIGAGDGGSWRVPFALLRHVLDI